MVESFNENGNFYPFTKKDCEKFLSSLFLKTTPYLTAPNNIELKSEGDNFVCTFSCFFSLPNRYIIGLPDRKANFALTNGEMLNFELEFSLFDCKLKDKFGLFKIGELDLKKFYCEFMINSQGDGYISALTTHLDMERLATISQIESLKLNDKKAQKETREINKFYDELIKYYQKIYKDKNKK